MSSRNLFLAWIASLAFFGVLITASVFGDLQGLSPIRERALEYLLLIDVLIGTISFLWLYIRWCSRYPLVIYGSILLFIISAASWSYASAVQRKEEMVADSEFQSDGEVVLSPERLDTSFQSESSIDRASDPGTAEPSKSTVASTPSPQPVVAQAKPTEEKKKKDTDDESKLHTDEMIREFKEDMRRMEKEEREQEKYYEKLAEQRKIDIANNAAKLAEQKKIAEAEAVEKKREQCRKDLQECMNDIGGKILGLSGSAYGAAARALSDSCHRKYSCN